MKSTYKPGQGIAVSSDKYGCSISLKIEVGNLSVDCSTSPKAEQFLQEFPESKRLPGWKQLLNCDLRSHFNNEKILQNFWDKLEIETSQRELVRDWLISALTHNSAPLISPSLVYGLA